MTARTHVRPGRRPAVSGCGAGVGPDDRPTMSRARRLHLRADLDDVVHRTIQMAVLGLVRGDSPSLAAVEDVRLALDEVLLQRAILDGPTVTLDVATSRTHCRLEVAIGLADLDVDTDLLSGLVDDVAVSRADGTTVVTLVRRWARPD